MNDRGARAHRRLAHMAESRQRWGGELPPKIVCVALGLWRMDIAPAERRISGTPGPLLRRNWGRDGERGARNGVRPGYKEEYDHRKP